MTWLPVDSGPAAERDAVLSLKPEFYAGLRNLLEIGWRATDARLLDLCRLRVAQMMSTRAELAGSDEDVLAELDDWRSSAAFGARERAALDYAEQYHIHHSGLTDEQKTEFGRHLSEREIFTFVYALWANDSYMRVLSLLDVEPDPPSESPRPDRHPPTGTTEPAERPPAPADADSPLDPEFAAQYWALSRTIVRRASVEIDDVTSEVVRLRNANHQACRY